MKHDDINEFMGTEDEGEYVPQPGEVPSSVDYVWESSIWESHLEAIRSGNELSDEQRSFAIGIAPNMLGELARDIQQGATLRTSYPIHDALESNWDRWRQQQELQASEALDIAAKATDYLETLRGCIRALPDEWRDLRLRIAEIIVLCEPATRSGPISWHVKLEDHDRASRIARSLFSEALRAEPLLREVEVQLRARIELWQIEHDRTGRFPPKPRKAMSKIQQVAWKIYCIERDDGVVDDKRRTQIVDDWNSATGDDVPRPSVIAQVNRFKSMRKSREQRS
jgi:hypothetical protein